ncbi:hypothetical protein SAY86_025370 [Trapa natans]|uniref:CN hydrolase domain-containing protein n=1 Tax=Trapa natans TaxID=22666 RepID=A0AAN7MQW7_TRANT|nr:hypothetical protein SAY86_025370 [Trapa natans]
MEDRRKNTINRTEDDSAYYSSGGTKANSNEPPPSAVPSLVRATVSAVDSAMPAAVLVRVAADQMTSVNDLASKFATLLPPRQNNLEFGKSSKISFTRNNDTDLGFDVEVPGGMVYKESSFTEVLLVHFAFTKVAVQAHWEALLRTHAIETQCYVIAAAQAGKHNDKRESYDRLATGIAVADIDISVLDSVRTKMPLGKVIVLCPHK